MKRKIFNINTFSFYRRQVKPKDLDRAFIDLIEKEERKINEEKNLHEKKEDKSNFIPDKKNNLKDEKKFSNTERNKNGEKKLSLNLIFPKISIERIMKIRDLFLEFDVDKNRTFDQDEIYLMFNMNKIPLTKEEVIDLFGFNNRKKFISFFEFIQLTVNEHFSNKFKKLIMGKIRYRCHESDICPNDFSDMLSHLCEFGKLSPELKDKTREGQMKMISENEKISSKTLDNHENKNFHQINSVMTDIVQNLVEHKVKNKFYFNNEKDINEIRENPNLAKKEKEFKNFMEISEKKYWRFREYLTKANIRDKILQKKEKVSRSLKIINKINPEIANDFICYYPTENVFKIPKNNKILYYPFYRNKQNYEKYPNMQFNKTEKNKNILSPNEKNQRNHYFKSHKAFNNNLMKLTKNKKYNTITKSLNCKYKTRKDKLKEKEYISILEKLALNNPNFPTILNNTDSTRFNTFKNKNRYHEKTFITTGLYSTFNKF